MIDPGMMNLYDVGTDLLLRFAKSFNKPMKLSIIARDPDDRENEMIISDDDIDGLIDSLQRMKASTRTIVPGGGFHQ